MIKQILAASAVAMLAASPAVAQYKPEPKPGTPASHVQPSDARGGYVRSNTYIAPYDGSTYRRGPAAMITAPFALAAAPFSGGFGAYAAAPAEPRDFGYAASYPTVMAYGKSLGWDPDPNVRLQMIRGGVEIE